MMTELGTVTVCAVYVGTTVMDGTWAAVVVRMTEARMAAVVVVLVEKLGEVSPAPRTSTGQALSRACSCRGEALPWAG